MTGDGPKTWPRHEPERIHERAADPAEAASRSLEPRAPDEAHRASGTVRSGKGAER